ncbi:transglycosylase domain-containing protein [Melghirimyces algeriensis]|uniref:Penicillin-binding protein 2A n=1 Tax=Melghirimyces algeriensis TaxID=910412 RepID=A0A521DPG1_9BACL|nr:transglycosylase domain-containing protein [Melghirimyces algeriensis]SMO73583.1 penicillin-binding protein 2A [Melghirimyces algeriensis]
MAHNSRNSGGLPPRSGGGRRSNGRSTTNRSGSVAPYDRSGNGSPVSRSSRGSGRRGKRGGRNNKKNFFRFFNWKWILGIFMTLILVAVGYYWYLAMNTPQYSKKDVLKKMESSSTVYDRNGKKVMDLGGANREYVKLEDIKSKDLATAFVKVEDERFYKHNGVDYQGLARAVVKNIIALGKAEGASTITMQVARNVGLGTREKTYTRKLREIIVARDFEKRFDKDFILEVYLNYIDFGNGVKGIKMAAKIYFDKDITKEKLEPHEIALLAGLPKAPYGYNPYAAPEKAEHRRNVVLNKMAEQNTIDPLITQAEADKYKKKDLGTNPEYIDKYVKKNAYDAFRDVVLDEIGRRYPGVKKTDLVNGGYKVYTTLDPNAQKAAEAALEKKEFFLNQETGQPAKDLNAALTLMNKKGEILAVGGGRNYKTGFYNWSRMPIQPGSSIKPITVYGPAVKDHGYNEYTMVKDEPIKFKGGYEPKNETGKFYGEIPLQEVVNKSLNVSTLRILRDVVKLAGAEKYAEKAGIKLHKKDRGSWAALALGGMTKGASTIQMAQAYSAFANVKTGGIYPAHTVKEIKGQDGETLEPAKPIPETPNPVYDKKTAWYMTRMLKDNVERGTGTNAQIPGHEVAGKTGTTQKSKESWFVGYTADYIGAVTVFNEKEAKVELSGGGYAAPIFKEVMSKLLEGKPPQRFKNPGVPAPKPPFELKPIQDLKGEFNSGTVNLKWSDYSDRLEYRVERSADGQSWTGIGKTSEGTFSDNNIQVSGETSEDPSKTFYYRVIAIDTKAEDAESKESDPSNVVTVLVLPEEPEEDQNPEDQNPEDENPEDQTPGDQDPNGQNPNEQDPNEQDPTDLNPDDENPDDQNPDEQDPNEQNPNGQGPIFR